MQFIVIAWKRLVRLDIPVELVPSKTKTIIPGRALAIKQTDWPMGIINERSLVVFLVRLGL